MTLLRNISSELNAMSSKMRSGAKRALNAESRRLRSEFQSRSPVDTGEYRSGWKLRSGGTSGDGFASVVIYNENEISELMEFGALLKQAPWYYPSGKKRSGKLAIRNGRVWAGGIKPGHTLTFGGAIGSGLFRNSKRMQKLVKNIADGAIGGIK